MWNHPAIPPLTERDFLDVEDILVSCKLCPSLQLTYVNLAAHIEMHDRRNHALAMSKEQMCQYGRGLKRNSGDFIPDAALVTGFYTDGHSPLGVAKGHKTICNRSDAAQCALGNAVLFASLPYIEDQIYTFGDEYHSREEQGEFIPIEIMQSLSSDPGRNYFQMSCKDGRYWIHKTVDKNTLVRVNEVVVLDVMLNIPLAPGDIISIANTKDDFKKDYVFKFKPPMACNEPKSVWDMQMKVPLLKVVENESEDLARYFSDNNVVLSQVFRRMNLRDILPLRLVHKFWNEEALPFLKTRRVLEPFQKPKWPEWDCRELWRNGGDRLNVHNSMTVFKLVHRLGHLNFKKWNMDIPEVGVVVKKLSDDFRWLFCLELPLTRHVTHLTLHLNRISWGSGSQYDIWTIILAGLAPTLEYLKLCLSNTMPQQLAALQLPSMPLVTKLVLENRNLSVPTERVYAEWIKSVFLPLPRLRALTLEEVPYERLRMALEQLILVREGNDGRPTPPCGVSIVSKDRAINATWLNSALSLPSSSFYYIREFVGMIQIQDDVVDHLTQEEQLYQVLDKWANSLEELDLMILLNINDWIFPVGHPAFRLQLPSPMPRLQSLALTCVRLSGSNGILIEVGGGTRLEYCKAFPNLLSLTLWFNNRGLSRLRNDVGGIRCWEHVAPIYDFFFPLNEEEDSLCDTLRVLEVPLLVGRQVRRSPERLHRYFPNLASPPSLNIIDTEVYDDDDWD